MREQKSICTYKALSCVNHAAGSVGGKQTGSLANCSLHRPPKIPMWTLFCISCSEKMRLEEPVLSPLSEQSGTIVLVFYMVRFM